MPLFCQEVGDGPLIAEAPVPVDRSQEDVVLCTRLHPTGDAFLVLVQGTADVETNLSVLVLFHAYNITPIQS